jgi:hypothetical protein
VCSVEGCKDTVAHDHRPAPLPLPPPDVEALKEAWHRAYLKTIGAKPAEPAARKPTHGITYNPLRPDLIRAEETIEGLRAEVEDAHKAVTAKTEWADDELRKLAAERDEYQERSETLATEVRSLRTRVAVVDRIEAERDALKSQLDIANNQGAEGWQKVIDAETAVATSWDEQDALAGIIHALCEERKSTRRVLRGAWRVADIWKAKASEVFDEHNRGAHRLLSRAMWIADDVRAIARDLKALIAK